MERLITVSELKKVMKDRPDVNEYVRFLNVELKKAQAFGRSKYLWRAFRKITGSNGEVTFVPHEPLAVAIVVDRLRQNGFDAEVNDMGEQTVVSIAWDKLFYEKNDEVERYDSSTSDAIVTPKPKIETDRNSDETKPLTYMQKRRAEQLTKDKATIDAKRNGHKVDSVDYPTLPWVNSPKGESST